MTDLVQQLDGVFPDQLRGRLLRFLGQRISQAPPRALISLQQPVQLIPALRPILVGEAARLIQERESTLDPPPVGFFELAVDDLRHQVRQIFAIHLVHGQLLQQKPGPSQGIDVSES
ncbi:hypothetical protein [Micromonospora sp. WMMD1155]|uniref:hypothetical protein n=1 Tax=Micromonospora sp. WMMD1155 TaxID=3016094 RepID=UPI00249A453C|nr:hypothetical protein [Micromonospora sp. WMMD1155]WFE52888.1 hypothetical protein O7617_22365 [Micromonospora sp. WMMD1155]